MGPWDLKVNSYESVTSFRTQGVNVQVLSVIRKKRITEGYRIPETGYRRPDNKDWAIGTNMPKKKPELQIPLEEVLDSKKGKHGTVFQIKIAHYKPMWVPEMKLSTEALQSYVTGCPLPKKAYVVLERSYAKAPVKQNMRSMNFFSRSVDRPQRTMKWRVL